MQHLIQFVVGGAVMLLVAPLLYGTPFNHVLVFMPLFVVSMYATAVVQAYVHWRFSKRGADTATPGASENGRRSSP